MKKTCLNTISSYVLKALVALQRIKMRYSTESRDRIYVKGYWLLFFAKSMGKSLRNRYGQKLLDSAKKSTTDAINTASKRTFQKGAEVTGHFIDNKIADKITSVSKKKFDKELHNNNDEDMEITTHEKRYISTEEREQIIEELRLVPRKDAYFLEIIDELMLTLKRYISLEKRQ